jgi:hypothetical protein
LPSAPSHCVGSNARSGVSTRNISSASAPQTSGACQEGSRSSLHVFSHRFHHVVSHVRLHPCPV